MARGAEGLEGIRVLDSPLGRERSSRDQAEVPEEIQGVLLRGLPRLVGDYLASGLDGSHVHVHGTAQDQVAQIMKGGRLVIHGDVGQTFMYGAKGGETFVLGNAAGRPLINAVGGPRVVINGTALD